MKIASLFTGAGGLDLGLHQVRVPLPSDPVWTLTGRRDFADSQALSNYQLVIRMQCGERTFAEQIFLDRRRKSRLVSIQLWCYRLGMT